MKKTIFLLILTVLGSMIGYSQELPKSTKELVTVTQTAANFTYISSSYSENHSLIAAINTSNNDETSILTLDNVDILEVLRHELDIPNSPLFAGTTSISNALGSIVGNANISQNYDLQARFSIINLHDGSLVKQFTLRNMKIGARLLDQKLVNDEYLYILFDDAQSNTTIEQGYSGIPFNVNNGTKLNHNGPILIQVRISDARVRTFPFQAETRFKRKSLTVDHAGRVYLQALDHLASETFHLLGLDTELQVMFQSPEIQGVKFDVTEYYTRMLHAYILDNEYLVYWNGVAPGIYNITTGENIISTDLKTGLDWSSSFQFQDVNIQDIHHIPGTDKFLFVRNSLSKGIGPWMQVVNIKGERSLFFRERIECTKNGVTTISRPYIIGSYFDSQKRLHYMGMYTDGGMATLNGAVIANGNQPNDAVVLYEGVLEGIDVNFPTKGGLHRFTPTTGDVTYDTSDGNNNIIYSGYADVTNIVVNREVAEGYTAVPDSYVPSNGMNFTFDSDFSNNRVYRTAIVNTDVAAGQTVDQIDIVMIVKEFAQERLSTETFDQNKIVMYPNPASDKVSFTFDVDVDSNEVEIYNLMGQKVFRKTNVFSGEPLDISSFSRGIYIVRFSVNGKSSSKKLVLR